MKPMRVLIIGLTGMLGHTLFQHLTGRADLDVAATVRNREHASRWFAPDVLHRTYDRVNADDFDSVVNVLHEFRPDVVVNCIGIIKQLPVAKDPIVSISVNALFPHRLAEACKKIGARLIHFSTDCVFSGRKGNYTESDPSDADDLYGRTKYLGEVSYPHCITLRTSIIGHELKGNSGLIDWFLSQTGKVRGFVRAIYTGFPTVEIGNIVGNHIIPRTDLSGVYHVSSKPISKFELLTLVAKRYEKTIKIEPYPDFVCDRSLDSTRFRKETGYVPSPWPELIDRMYLDFKKKKYYHRIP